MSVSRAPRHGRSRDDAARDHAANARRAPRARSTAIASAKRNGRRVRHDDRLLFVRDRRDRHCLLYVEATSGDGVVLHRLASRSPSSRRRPARPETRRAPRVSSRATRRKAGSRAPAPRSSAVSDGRRAQRHEEPAHDRTDRLVPRPRVQRHERDVQRLALPRRAFGRSSRRARPTRSFALSLERRLGSQHDDIPHRGRQHDRDGERLGAAWPRPSIMALANTAAHAVRRVGQRRAALVVLHRRLRDRPSFRRAGAERDIPSVYQTLAGALPRRRGHPRGRSHGRARVSADQALQRASRPKTT